MNDKWDGKTERREYCAMHCRVAQDIKGATPWKFTIIYNGLLILIIGVLAGWYQLENNTLIKDIDKFKIEVNAKIVRIEDRLQGRLIDSHREHNDILNRIFRQIEVATSEINTVKIQTEVIRQKQEMVLKKIKITD